MHIIKHENTHIIKHEILIQNAKNIIHIEQIHNIFNKIKFINMKEIRKA
jgi:hypothetical protein